MQRRQYPKKNLHNPCPPDYSPVSPMEPLLSVREVAAYLGVSTSTVYREIKRGLPYYKDDLSTKSRLRFKQEDVKEWINRHKKITFLADKVLKKALTYPSKIHIDNAEGGRIMASKSRARRNYGYGSVYKRKKGKSWVIDYRDADGKRVQKAVSEAETKEEAVLTLKMEVAKLLKGKNGFEQKKQKMGFRNFSQIYLQDYAMIDKKSWQTDEYRLSKLKDFFMDIELREITPSMIRKFRASRLKDGIAESTTNREMALLKKMFSLAIDEDYLEHNPAKKIKMYSELDSIRDRTLLPEEEPRFYAEFAEHAKPVALLGQYAGLRLGEALNLEWRNMVLRGLKDSYIKVEKTKSKKAREIPINSILFDVLTKLKANSGKSKVVFPFKSVRTAFTNACKRAGIEGFTFHDLRRTFGTRMLERGVDIVTISKLYGHSNVLVTQRYLHPKDKLSKEAVELLVEKPVGDNLVTKEEAGKTKMLPIYSFSMN